MESHWFSGCPQAGSHLSDLSSMARTWACIRRTRTALLKPSRSRSRPPGVVTSIQNLPVSTSRRLAMRSSSPVNASGLAAAAAR